MATGTGSVGVLQQVVQATAGEGDEVVYAWRSFEAYPIVVQISGARSVQRAADRRRAPRPRRDGRRHHRPDPAGASSARRTTRPARRSAASELERFLDRVPARRAGRHRRGLPRVRARPRGARRPRRLPRPSQRRRPAHVLEGLWARRPAGRLRGGARAGGRRVAQDRRAVRSQQPGADRGDRVAARARTSCSSGSKRWSRSGPGSPTRCGSRAGTQPASEANFVWLRLGERTSEFAAACEAAGVVVRPFADEGARVTIGETEANDIFLGVAARFSH